MLRAIETGYVQREIQNAAYEYQQQSRRGERIVVGVNRFRAENEAPIPILRDRSRHSNGSRSNACALCARAATARAPQARSPQSNRRARSGENLMPAILDAVEAFATVGEISDALRRVFGEHRETVAL